MSQLAILLAPNPFVANVSAAGRYSAYFRRKFSISAAYDLVGRNPSSITERLVRRPILLKEQFSSISPTTYLGRNLVFRPSPEIGLLSLFLVLSLVLGAFFSLAIISLPTMNAFRRLEVSADRLSKVVSEEVPGTLSSLKLSGLEISDLTQQLSSLRQRISGNQRGTKKRTSMPRSNVGRNNPVIN